MLIAFVVGYLYAQWEHHPSILGLWAGLVGVAGLCWRVVTVWKFLKETEGNFSPRQYWQHHFSRHKEFSYQSCPECRP